MRSTSTKFVSAFVLKRRTADILATRRCQQDTRKRESREDKILDQARELYERRGNRPVEIWVNFAPYFTWTRDESAIFTASLVSFVEENVPRTGRAISFTNDTLPESIQEAFNSISIACTAGETYHPWFAPRAGWFPKLTPSAVQSEIADKERHLNQYRHGCDDVWLLIAAEEGVPSSWWEISPEAQAASYETGFDRVFLMADVPRQLVELSTTKQYKKLAVS